MKSREELTREFADAPPELIGYACQLQDQLAEARAYIAELKQQLFGPKADKLTPEQEEQLQQLAAEAPWGHHSPAADGAVGGENRLSPPRDPPFDLGGVGRGGLPASRRDAGQGLGPRGPRQSRDRLPLRRQSTWGKAATYFLKEYTVLVGYLRDGRFEIDNNLVENDVRPSAVDRRRGLFIGHPDAGWRTAVIYTIIQSCRRHGINPQEYLTDVLGRLPSMKNHEVKELLPSRWKPTSSRSA